MSALRLKLVDTYSVEVNILKILRKYNQSLFNPKSLEALITISFSLSRLTNPFRIKVSQKINITSDHMYLLAVVRVYSAGQGGPRPVAHIAVVVGAEVATVLTRQERVEALQQLGLGRLGHGVC